VAGRIDEDRALVSVGLVVGQPGPQPERALDAGLDVVDGDVEVHLHLLVLGAAGPRRVAVELLELERQAGAPVVGSHRHPVVLLGGHRPAEQLLVEGGETARVGRPEDGGGEPVAGSVHPHRVESRTDGVSKCPDAVRGVGRRTRGVHEPGGTS
jgi:hypothetical protein